MDERFLHIPLPLPLPPSTLFPLITADKMGTGAEIERETLATEKGGVVITTPGDDPQGIHVTI